MDLSPGAVIAGRYRVDGMVDAGGKCGVWEGESIRSGTRVAMKTMHRPEWQDYEDVARFKRQVYFLERIQSKSVPRVVDFVADDVYGPVLVMEFVEGEPLSRILEDRILSVEEGIDLGIGIANALKDVHARDIIHRDLKPEHIITRPLPGGTREVIVVGFRMSRILSDNGEEDEELRGITRPGQSVGTIEYMAPEQILNARNVTPSSDIYAAGAILFRALVGWHVFGDVESDTVLAQKKLTTESPPLRLWRTDEAAAGLARVVGKMLKRRPSERYKRAREVLDDLLSVREVAHLATAARDAPAPVDELTKPPPLAVAPAPIPQPQIPPLLPTVPTRLPSALRRLDTAPRLLLVVPTLLAGALGGFALLTDARPLRLAAFALLLLLATAFALTSRPVARKSP